jgi:hypothetical protein
MRSRAAGHGHLRSRPFPEIAALLLLLLLLQLVPAEIWRGGLPLLVLLAGFAWMNARRFPGGAVCWPTIFLAVLALFHLGYYIPVYHGIADGADGMPDLSYAGEIDQAMHLIALACVAFELGAFAVLAVLARRPVRAAREDASRDRAFLNLGVAITALSFVLFVIYIDQIGGLEGLRRLDYSVYVNFLQSSDPRFAALSITYLPAGLLLIYTFLDRTKPGAVWKVRVIVGVFLLFTLWLLWIGNRGAALLAWAALLYIHHLRFKPLPLLRILVIGVAIALVISPVRQLRNLTPTLRGEAVSKLDFNPVNAVTEMGLTFRPYLEFVRQRELGTSLGTTPYRSAIEHVPPRIGVEGASQAQSQDYVRSNVWITQRVDPVYASAGYGLGGSAVGEPYLAFGEWGVMGAFVLLGLLIALIEWRAVVLRSSAALALVPLVFYSVNFHVRDDVYGLMRFLVWGIAAVLLTTLLARLLGRRSARQSRIFERSRPPKPAAA